MKHSLRMLALACALGAMPLLAQAQLVVADPWVRATVPQQQATGAFMTLTMPQGARLIEARSPAAPVVEIHEMVREGDVMKMRAITGLDLPAGKTVKLEPGGYHVMLMGLQKPISAGETVPITLVIETADRKRETVEVKAPVRPLNAAAGAGAGAHRH